MAELEIREQSDGAALRQAVQALQAALDEFRQHNVPAYAAVVERNLVRVQGLLQSRQATAREPLRR